MKLLDSCLRYAWASPNTITGIAIGLLLGGRFQFRDGVLEIYGPRIAQILSRFPISPLALTLGHVVFARSEQAHRQTRRHERVHVRQYEVWGPLFVPAYLLESLWLYRTGRDGYLENHFEIEAYAVDRADQASETT